MLENRPSKKVVEGELKGLVLVLTPWVEASAESVFLSKPNELWR